MSQPRTRPPGTIRIGTVAGSDVLVSGSWFLVAGLIAVLMAPLVDAVRPGLGSLRYVAGFAFAVLLYGSVLLHEISHALVARRFGLPVGDITLHFLGGMTHIEEESRRPREELLVAVVGPITSLAVAGVALALIPITPDGLPQLAVRGLAGSNLVVGVLNLVPAFPLDGGRVLRAVVWAVTGDRHRGSIAAGWGGRVAAVAAVVYPWWGTIRTGARPDAVDLVLFLLIAVFLWQGGSQAIATGRLRRRLPALRARTLARRALAVPGDLPLAEAVRRTREAQAGAIITTTTAGEPTGVVHEPALLATPEDRWPWVATSTVARTLDRHRVLAADLEGEDLVEAVGRGGDGEYLLVEQNGAVLGVLVTADLDAAFRESLG
ncbi:site-2 protease family protein [Nocardioides sp. GY 10127]|uniref:site-2 protease family protein n=1 Tax=Nocardioides sp. GY 10127 TaxID=2569762 RepID=UPI0010A8CBC7|nr:site-2 protease family protein [Nocardioides sp. GY 10127]TIC86493.1 site-2 protease family protein [Nocardioides sp. GY 10127]